MTTTETIAFLRHFNRWRRGDNLQQPCAGEVGKAIDAACDHIERLEVQRDESLYDATQETLKVSALKSQWIAVCQDLKEARKALEDIAALDTSQDASPQQCAAVLLAMNALGK